MSRSLLFISYMRFYPLRVSSLTCYTIIVRHVEQAFQEKGLSSPKGAHSKNKRRFTRVLPTGRELTYNRWRIKLPAGHTFTGGQRNVFSFKTEKSTGSIKVTYNSVTYRFGDLCIEIKRGDRTPMNLPEGFSAKPVSFNS